MITILDAGLLTTVQDRGRPGYAHLGVTRSGALDQPALRLANHLVGNPDGAAGLETTLTGVTLRAEVATTIAITGALAPITVDDHPVGWGEPLALAAGSVLRVGAATAGCRGYLAVAGGIAVEPVLGSRSTDTLSGLGPAPLRAGAALPLGTAHPPGTAHPLGAAGPTRAEAAPVGGAAIHSAQVRVRWGPRHDWFTATALAMLFSAPYRVTPLSNRVGIRLDGAPLARAVPGELPSEGLVLGAVQVPASGQPLVFLHDHPTTGGYPVIGVVEADDLPRLAQAVPGEVLRFTPWS